MRLKVGDQAEGFSAVDQTGATVRLSDYLEKGPVALFFYPGAMTPGCTAESCHFRDLRSEFAALGAQPVGISADPPGRQAEFDRRHDLGMPLLSDTDHSIARRYGVRRRVPPSRRRLTFVIDRDSTVVAVISDAFNMNGHADRALTALRERASAAG